MGDDEKTMRQSETPISVGDDLYGCSLEELRERIRILQLEVSRTEAELSKKQTERAAADQLFGSGS